MVCLTISIILLILVLCGVHIPYWVVSLPATVAASLALWLLIKAEFEYFKSLNKKNKETTE